MLSFLVFIYLKKTLNENQVNSYLVTEAIASKFVPSEKCQEYYIFFCNAFWPVLSKWCSCSKSKINPLFVLFFCVFSWETVIFVGVLKVLCFESAFFELIEIAER